MDSALKNTHKMQLRISALFVDKEIGKFDLDLRPNVSLLIYSSNDTLLISWHNSWKTSGFAFPQCPTEFCAWKKQNIK